MVNEEEFEQDIIDSLEQAINQQDRRYYVLRLYIAGTTPQSIQALQNLTKICEEYLKERYELEVIDIYQNPAMAVPGNIFAIPTLIKQLPPPLQILIGNLSNTEKVLVGLDICSIQNHV
ncbi:thiol-disulfide isomerase [Phormidium sp. LEGE 05292]|uniref:circadian clock KaiB family protein n=1 Tax=[Phormidium] sp. LEGE 05292 TaxID=767427 RepID=UPI00188009E7|nr:circadian clock KaiB family protein [Phormidium sp. LEGE 05292]MBE9228306.1 thiol-disulfide isomerase [Phormidium sp. LEGE 05292]